MRIKGDAKTLFLFFCLVLSSVGAYSESVSGSVFDENKTKSIGEELFQLYSFNDEALEKLERIENEDGIYSSIYWIAYKRGRVYSLAGISKENGDNRVVAEVFRRGSTEKIKFRRLDRQLSDEELVILQAHHLVAGHEASKCGLNQRIFVVDLPRDDALYAYRISLASDPNYLQLGGHYRYRLTSTGDEIEAIEPLSSRCRELNLFPEILNGEKLRRARVLDEVGIYPLETHILFAGLHDLALTVGTRRNLKMWKIAGGMVSNVGE